MLQSMLLRGRTLPSRAIRHAQQHRQNHHHVVPLIIDGSDVYSEKFQVTGPLTNTAIWSATAATRQHVEDAVTSAQAAFPAWSTTKPSERRDIFLKAADVMERRKDELVGYMHQEIGASSDMQNFIFDLSVEGLKDTAGRIAGATAGTAPHSTHKGMRALVEKVPYGVVLGIGPW
jgi:acyl-CoA reductase-like NAD-dependent aldehyde dehydrogenase